MEEHPHWTELIAAAMRSIGHGHGGEMSDQEIMAVLEHCKTCTRCDGRREDVVRLFN